MTTCAGGLPAGSPGGPCETKLVQVVGPLSWMAAASKAMAAGTSASKYPSDTCRSPLKMRASHLLLRSCHRTPLKEDATLHREGQVQH